MVDYLGGYITEYLGTYRISILYGLHEVSYGAKHPGSRKEREDLHGEDVV